MSYLAFLKREIMLQREKALFLALAEYHWIYHIEPMAERMKRPGAPMWIVFDLCHKEWAAVVERN